MSAAARSLYEKAEAAVEALTPPPPVVLTLGAEEAAYMEKVLREGDWVSAPRRIDLADKVAAARRGGA